MILLKNTIEISKPIDEVYRYLRRMEHIPQWNYYVKSVERIHSEKSGEEAYHQVRQKSEEFFGVTVDQEKYEILIVSFKKTRLQFKRILLLTVTGDRSCRLNDHFELSIGFATFLLRPARMKMQKAVGENLQKLKKLLETG